MKLLLVLNPVSGGTDKTDFLRYAKDRCHFFGIDLSLFRTTGEADCDRLKDSLQKEKPDRIASAGGDGTFLLVVQATVDNPIPTGFIPMGSANGMARELGVPDDVYEAFDELMASRMIAEMDLLKVNDKHLCLHMGDVGLNAEMVAGFEADDGRGMATYGKYLLRTLTQMEEFSYSFQHNGETISGTAVMIGIGNGSKFGTGIPMNTVGNPFDGKFEITIVETINADTILRAGLSLFDETFLKEAETTVYSMTEAQIKLEQPQTLQLDGELIGKVDELNVKVETGKVRLVTTGGNRYLEE